MKRCFKCERELPESEFYRHSQMADGRLGKCMACTRANVTANRQRRLERYRAYDRQRATTEPRVALRDRVTREWRQIHPGRAAAQSQAQRHGRPAPELCESCGEAKRLERHHPDYSQPLLIQWLCKPCHYKADEVRRLAEVDTDLREVPGTQSYYRELYREKGYEE